MKNFITAIKNLWNLSQGLKHVSVDKRGNMVLQFKRNCLLSSEASIGLHTESNLIIESDLLAMNTMNQYGVRSVANTATLMTASYRGLTTKLENLPEHTLSLCDNASSYSANDINVLLKQNSIKLKKLKR